jgi:predicted DNA-binding protein
MKYEAKLVNLTKKQMSALRNMTKHTGRPVSWLIRAAINHYLDSPKP